LPSFGDPLDTRDIVVSIRDDSVDAAESEPSGVTTLYDDAVWLAVVIQVGWLTHVVV
jgi:hypothetical protein